ncbi:MAG: hypothetical protein K1X95_02900 [Acidimicrobiia bacterium]|nr:hypothetical protein [Acidimicrobiia bacterium]
MAQDLPSAADLLAACRGFLEGDVMDALTGRLRFHTRVVANVLGVVERELRDGPVADAAELAGLVALLGHDGDIGELNAELAARIRDGSLDERRAEVLTHVRETVEAKVRISNPGYLRE